MRFSTEMILGNLAMGLDSVTPMVQADTSVDFTRFFEGSSHEPMSFRPIEMDEEIDMRVAPETAGEQVTENEVPQTLEQSRSITPVLAHFEIVELGKAPTEKKPTLDQPSSFQADRKELLRPLAPSNRELIPQDWEKLATKTMLGIRIPLWKHL